MTTLSTSFQRLYPASAPTRFWTSPTGPIAYDDQGQGPLVLCVPGMGDVRQSFRFLAPRLVAAGYRVVTVDNRGQGESTCFGSDFSVAGVGADLAGLLDSLSAGPAGIISNSMGGGASVWLAAQRPDLIKRLVLLAPFVRTEPTLVTDLLYSALFGGPWGPSMWTAYFASIFPVRKPEDFALYRAALRANLSEPGRMKSLRAMLKASKSASESRLPLVRAPSLVIMGTKDPDFPKPEAEARWVAQQLRSDFRMVDGAGHHPHVDTPDTSASLILEFLEG